MRKHLGFTLIELLVVVSILGILVGLIVNNLSDSRARARDSQRKSNLNQLKTALRLYYNDYQKYSAVSPGVPGGSFTVNNTIYMKQLPAEFTYNYIDDDSFTLKVTLENASDTDLAASQKSCLGAADSSLNFYVCSD